MAFGAAQVAFPGKKDQALSSYMMGAASDGQPPEMKQAVEMTWQMWQKARTWREQWAKHWPRFWNVWETNHYQGRIVHTLTRAVVNMVFSQIETFIGHAVDNLQEPQAKARRRDYEQNGKVLTKWLKYVWDSSNAETEIEHIIRSAAVTGIGWAEIPWDETADGNKGLPKFLPVDEKFIFVAPYARNLKEALYLIDARNVPREWALDIWGEQLEGVPPGPWDGSLFNQRQYNGGLRDSDSYAQFKTTDGAQTAWTGSNADGLTQKRSDVVTLVKNWIRQRDGTMRLLMVVNGTVVQDGPSPYDDDDFPYVQFNLIPTLDSPYGRSLVQFVEGLQEILDLSLSYLLDQQRYASDPMLIVDAANIEESDIDNMPGAILFNRNPQGKGYEWMQAPGFNQAWIQVQQMVTEYMDSVLGRVDVLRGERPAGVNTLGGLEIVRDEANVRIRNLVRWLKSAQKRAMLLIISRLRQFVKDERTMRITGKYGKEEYVTVNQVKEAGPEGEPVQEFTIPEDAEFDVEFGKDDFGGKQAKLERAVMLATTPAEDGLPMVDRQYVLEEAEIEQAPEIMERLAQMQQAQAQAQQAQAVGPDGQPAAPEEEMSPQDMVMQLFGGAGA